MTQQIGRRSVAGLDLDLHMASKSIAQQIYFEPLVLLLRADGIVYCKTHLTLSARVFTPTGASDSTLLVATGVRT